MSKYKLKNSPKKLLMESCGLDAEATNVILHQLHQNQLVLTCEDNALYLTGSDGTKNSAASHPGFVNMINELKNFAEMKSDKTILYYLYEKIKTLENKIESLEKENENMSDKIKELDGTSPYHD